MSKYKGKIIHTITADDVGKKTIKYTACKACNTQKVIWLAGSIGCVQACDIGKQIVEEGGIHHVESDEQRDKRLKSTQDPCESCNKCGETTCGNDTEKHLCYEPVND